MKQPLWCIDCDQSAIWRRKTQFSGVHPFCEKHARQQSDFGKEDPSYFFWEEIPPSEQSIQRREPDPVEKLILAWRAEAVALGSGPQSANELFVNDAVIKVYQACADQLEAAYIGPDPAKED